MACDSHMHLGVGDLVPRHLVQFMTGRRSSEEMERLLTVDGLLNQLDLASIQRAIVMPLTFETESIGRANDLIAAVCEQNPERLVGFCTVDVHDCASANAEMDRARGSGIIGIKLHPSFQEFDPSDRGVFPVYEHAQALGMPILLHTGAATSAFSDRLSRPSAVDDVAAAFPSLVMIMAHGGRLWFEEAAMVMRKYRNVYIDISANVARDGSPYVLRRLLRLVKSYVGGVDRVLFGSDYPVYLPSMMRELLMRSVDVDAPAEGPAITDGDVQSILDAGDVLIRRISASVN